MELTRYSVPILLIVWNLISLVNCEIVLNFTDIKYPDVDAERELARLYGIIVPIGLCIGFLSTFAICYTYNKLKSHRPRRLKEPYVIKKEEPHVTIKKEPFMITKASSSTYSNKHASHSEQQSAENCMVEPVIQITRL